MKNISRKMGKIILPIFAITFLFIASMSLFSGKASADSSSIMTGAFVTDATAQYTCQYGDLTIGAAPGGTTGGSTTQTIPGPKVGPKNTKCAENYTSGQYTFTLQNDGQTVTYKCQSGYDDIAISSINGGAPSCAPYVGTVIKNTSVSNGVAKMTKITVTSSTTYTTETCDSSGNNCSTPVTTKTNGNCGDPAAKNATDWTIDTDGTCYPKACVSGYTLSSDKKTCSVQNSPATSSCNVSGGVGFIICPIASTMSNFIDDMYAWLGTSLLQINTQSLVSNQGLMTTTIIPVANVVLVIVFLLVIYSEATGNGFGSLSNYSIKKTLPRLIIFAVIINVSFYVCIAAVDLSNIVGASAGSFLTGKETPQAQWSTTTTCLLQDSSSATPSGSIPSSCGGTK